MNKEQKKKKRKYPHYFKQIKGFTEADVYRVLRMFEVTDPAIAHAIKKLMAAGKRGYKDAIKDVSEAIDSCNRFIEMEKEDNE